MATKTTSPSRAAAPAKKRGNMKPAEIKPLVMAARKAFDIQASAGLLNGWEDFDAWRHAQCMAAVGKPGLTRCNHGDYKPLLAHFQTLAGDDAAAFRTQMQTGKPTDHAAPGDTHEARRNLSNQIAQALNEHLGRGGQIDVGYLIYITRQKTRRPDLTLGSDWQAGLAERCTANQLEQIRDTIINRIAAAEGTGSPASRNKSQRRRAGESD